MKMAAGETLHQLLRSDFACVLGCPKEVSVYQLNMPNKVHDNMKRSATGHCLAEVLWNVLIAPDWAAGGWLGEASGCLTPDRLHCARYTNTE